MVEHGLGMCGKPGKARRVFTAPEPLSQPERHTIYDDYTS